MTDLLRARVRTDALEHAAAAAWEHDHPSTPWAEAPDSVRLAMRALVRPTVDAVLEHLDAQALLDLEPMPDTFPHGASFETAISRARDAAYVTGGPARFIYKGVPLVALPADTWHDTAGRYAAAAEDAAR